MQHKGKARPAVGSKRASVKNDSSIIPRWDKGCWLFAALMLAGWCSVVVMEVAA